MTPARQPPRSVAVIGGGISGLAAAHRLTELAPDLRLQLFEASDALGGALQARASDGFPRARAAGRFTPAKAGAAGPASARRR